MKYSIKSIILIAIFVLAIWTRLLPDQEIWNWLFWILLLAYLIFILWKKVQFKMAKNANEIRLPSQNDNFVRYTQLTFGLIITAVCIGALFRHVDAVIIGPLLLGVLLFLNGIFSLPEISILIIGDKIKSNWFREVLDQSELSKLSVSSDHIVIHKNTGAPIYLYGLRLQNQDIEHLKVFLKKERISFDLIPS